MTQTKRVAYQLFTQAILLLVLYAVVALLTALKFLPDDLLFNLYTYAQMQAYSHVLLKLFIWTGLVASGIYVTAAEQTSGELQFVWFLNGLKWLWTLLVVVANIASWLGWLEAAPLRELPILLESVAVILLFLFVITVIIAPNWSTVRLVWVTGMVISLMCIVATINPPNHFWMASVIGVLSTQLEFNVGYVLAALALGFWLMRRFSNITQYWADSSLHTTGGLLALAGTIVSLTALTTLDVDIGPVGLMSVVILPLLLVIYTAHSYRALWDRNPAQTLSAHWYVLAMVLWLFGLGLLGAALSLPEIRQYTEGTRLSDLQFTLVSFGVVAVILGMINQSVAEMRAENRRITGLMPFWLVCFGLLIGGTALSMAGVVQVYMERAMSIGYLETQAAIVPLYIVWIIGLTAMTIGIIIYALGFRVRRIRTL